MRFHVAWEGKILTLYNESKGLQLYNWLILFEYVPIEARALVGELQHED